jgi:high-affinity iron transporter
VLLPSWLGIWFGVFATWQGILLQVGSVVVVLGSYFLAEHQASRRRSKPREGSQMEASTSV